MSSNKSVLILINLYPLFSRLRRQNITPTLIPPDTQAKFNYKLIVFELYQLYHSKIFLWHS